MDRGRASPPPVPWNVVTATPSVTSEGVINVNRRLARPRDDRKIAGVCAALARRFGLSTGLVRLLFVLSILLPGPQVLIYIILWIMLPNEY